MRATLRSLLFSALALAVLAACTRQENLLNLDRAMQDYHTRIQFKQLSEAAGFVDPQKKEEFYPIAEKLTESCNIAGYYIRSVTTNKDEDFATVIIVREIYDNETFEVRSETITQQWEKIDDSWMLTGGQY